MAEAAFKPGDVVQLKSIGPHMTIEEVDRGQCWCTWFDGREVRRDAFAAACLDSVKLTGPTRPLAHVV